MRPAGLCTAKRSSCCFRPALLVHPAWLVIAFAYRIVHRKGEELLRCDLPAKQEHILKLHLSPVQDAVYQAYLEVMQRCWYPRENSQLTKTGSGKVV